MTPKKPAEPPEEVDRLYAMFELQDSFEELATGMRFSQLATADDPALQNDRIGQFKEMKLAIEAELQEALDEMGWKPWASSRHFNTEAVQNELVDAWHFFMCLMLLAGMDPELLWQKYQEKIKINIRRQTEGYDGVKEKCPRCKRSYDDPQTDCHAKGTMGPAYCVEMGYLE